MSFYSFPSQAQEKKNNLILKTKENPNSVLSQKSLQSLERLKSSHTIKSVDLVKVSDLETLTNRKKLQINLQKSRGKLEMDKQLLQYKNGSLVYQSADFTNEVLIFKTGEATTAHIRKNKKVFDVQYLENGYAALIEYDLKEIDKLSCHATTSPANKKDFNEFNFKVKNNDINNVEFSQGGIPKVRLMVLYTPRAERSGFNMLQLINASVNQLVQSFRGSGVNVDVEVVYKGVWNFEETINMKNDFDKLKIDTKIKKLRNEKGADLVVLLTNGSFGDYQKARGAVKEIGPRNEDAFAIVQVHSATSVSNFAHEVAHLFGARHEQGTLIVHDNAPGDAHGHSWKGGSFYQQYIRPVVYRSIMHTGKFANSNDFTLRVNHFSNSYVKHENSKTGEAGNRNNARILNANAMVVSGFRGSPTEFRVQINGPSAADNGQTLSFTSRIFNGTPPFKFTWQSETNYGKTETFGNSDKASTRMPYGSTLSVTLTMKDANGKMAVGKLLVESNAINDKDPDTKISLDSFDIVNESDFESVDLLFPNPSKDIIFFNANFKDPTTQIKIFNGHGINIKEIKINEEKKLIDISHLKKGLYFLILRNQTEVKKFKFIKK